MSDDDKMNERIFGYDCAQRLSYIQLQQLPKIGFRFRVHKHQGCQTYLFFRTVLIFTLKFNVLISTTNVLIFYKNLENTTTQQLLYEEFSLLKSSINVISSNSKESTAKKWHQLFQSFPKQNTKTFF